MPARGSWGWGLLDGERAMRDRSERIQGDVVSREQPRRDDEDDNDRDRRGRDGYRGWREKLRRSLSRGARPRGRDNDGGSRGQGRERPLLWAEACGLGAADGCLGLGGAGTVPAWCMVGLGTSREAGRAWACCA
jgi:hypothetical protein